MKATSTDVRFRVSKLGQALWEVGFSIGAPLSWFD